MLLRSQEQGQMRVSGRSQWQWLHRWLWLGSQDGAVAGTPGKARDSRSQIGGQSVDVILGGVGSGL